MSKMQRCVLVICLFLACVAQVHGGKMFGLCYTPYRVFGACPTDAEVESDVEIMLRHTSRIRLYSTECRNVNRILLKHSSKGRLSVLFGVYLDNRATDQQEIDYLIEALQEYPNGNIAGVVVGNEVLFRNTLPKSTLIQRIGEVRGKVRGVGQATGNQSYKTAPIYSVEMYPNEDIGKASDVMGLNIHPFYRPDLVDVPDPDEMSEKILEAAKMQIDLYRNMMPGKKIVVTEIGWPTQSDPSEMHKGDPEIALKFMHKFTEYCEGAGIFYYWFEAFDSPWKKPMFPSNGNTMSEFNFGLYEEDRKTMKRLQGQSPSPSHRPAPADHPNLESHTYNPQPNQPHVDEPELGVADTYHSSPDYGDRPQAYDHDGQPSVFTKTGTRTFDDSEASSYAQVHVQSGPYRRMLIVR